MLALQGEAGNAAASNSHDLPGPARSSLQQSRDTRILAAARLQHPGQIQEAGALEEDTARSPVDGLLQQVAIFVAYLRLSAVECSISRVLSEVMCQQLQACYAAGTHVSNSHCAICICLRWLYMHDNCCQEQDNTRCLYFIVTCSVCLVSSLLTRGLQGHHACTAAFPHSPDPA